ncbi:MAG: ATP-binding cassette domain-containing protein [Betaproteobacteria bacterium]|nr:ATP-binding cassette domain-containing protein [Betaproteobacteria bacterium]
MLSVNQVHQYYGGSHILRDVSVSTRVGEVTVLLGRNGVGKTTLLKSIMGLVPIRSGGILMGQQDISKAKPYERAALGIGYVPQGREIFARLTVEDNLRMGLATCPAGTPIPQELFELFPVLEQMLHRRGGDLSGGQQQRLCIARGVAIKPEVLLLDEPCSALDPISTAKIEELITELKQDYTVVIVTHNMQQAARCSDHTAYMYLGDLVEFGPTEQLFFKPQRKETEDYITGRFG